MRNTSCNLEQFYETRNLFILNTGYIKPLTYEQWVLLPEDRKAAVLFVQFFDQVCLAWERANCLNRLSSADGVSYSIQDFMKQSKLIAEDPKRFSANYIYRTQYNMMYCPCHDYKYIQDMINNETSNIVSNGEEELNLYDTVMSLRGSAEDEYERREFEKEFWETIDKAGLEARKVVRYILSGKESDLRSINRRNKYYDVDPLRDVTVPLSEVESIIENLRSILAKFEYIIK